MLISVVIPVYNTKPEYIKECLDSIRLLNELCEYEVIVVNDGSTNIETCQFLNHVNETYKEISNFHILNKVNGGTSSAKNLGIDKAKGDYIFPLDSDDKININIKIFIEHLKNNPDIDILYGDLSIFGDKNEYHKFQPFHKYELWFFKNQLASCSIYKKEIWTKLNGYDETFKTCEDWDFWCRCATINAKFHYLPYANYDYRVINDGQSLYQQTIDLIPMYHQKTLEKYPLSTINPEELLGFVNDKFRLQIRKKRRKALGILIYAYFPKFFYWLCKKGVFSYKDNFFQI